MENPKIEKLINKYKTKTYTKKHSIISANFGGLGSIIIREVLGLNSSDKERDINYEPYTCTYLSILCTQRSILWTDYADIEPYNRDRGFYCDGESFESLGDPIVQTKEYREYDRTHKGRGHVSFSISPFYFNTLFSSYRFGLAILTDQVENFLIELRALIGK